MKLRLLFATTIIVLFFSSCKSKHIPDVSNIKVDVKIERFEKNFYSLDTNNLVHSLDELNKKYQSFLPDYLYQILGLTPPQDSIVSQIKLFLNDEYFFVTSL